MYHCWFINCNVPQSTLIQDVNHGKLCVCAHSHQGGEDIWELMYVPVSFSVNLIAPKRQSVNFKKLLAIQTFMIILQLQVMSSKINQEEKKGGRNK